MSGPEYIDITFDGYALCNI